MMLNKMKKGITKMSATNNIIKDRVEIARHIKTLGYNLCCEFDLDKNYSNELESKYVEFEILRNDELGWVNHSVRISDHRACKPGMSECLFDTFYNTIEEIKKAISSIAKNENMASEIYCKYNDVKDLSKWALVR